jgi:molecular chaperone HscA
MGGLVERIIPRNSTIPTARAQEIHHLQGRPDGDGHPLGAEASAKLGERLPVAWRASSCAAFPRWWPAPRASAWSFQVDADGLLHVSAREETSGVEAAIASSRATAGPDDEIARMLKRMLQHLPSPTCARRSLRESRVEARAHASLATRSALAVRRRLAEADERSDIDALLRRSRRSGGR